MYLARPNLNGQWLSTKLGWMANARMLCGAAILGQ
jgi:hypothetical protein